MIYKVQYLSQCCDKHESALVIADSMHNAFDIAIKVYGEDIMSISLAGGGAGADCKEAPASVPFSQEGSQKEGGDVYIRT